MSDVIAFSFENNKVRTLGTPETPLLSQPMSARL